MLIVFVSNFMNHHQLPLSNELLAIEGVEYWFIATEEIPRERIDMGYHDMNSQYSFVLRTYEDDVQREKALNLCINADVVIFGNSPQEFIKKRLQQKKLTYKYSERIYKKDPALWTMPLRFIKYFWANTRHKNLYMLCSSAYTAYDYSRTLTFVNKTYKWGYFPHTFIYDNIEEIIDNKETNSILWAGRMIDWKHPEAIIEVAKRLKENAVDFKINVVGTGIMENELKSMIECNHLSECVHLLGTMSPEDVRIHMINSQIYLFTSDKQEGWGAVLNEAMNSGCAVVACNAIGSVPFLLEDGVNGLTYEEKNIEKLYQKVKYLIENPLEQKRYGINAYCTMQDLWNAKVAAERIVKLSKELMTHEKSMNLFDEGPCSKAEIIRG